jgi:acyl-CoA synthetase (AMP-forming)/AMP-acid ligase II
MSDDHVWRSPFPPIDPTPAALHQAVLFGARARSRRIALVDAATGGSLTYGRLADRVARVAAGLRRLGAGPGDVLALVAGNCPEFPVVLHGALAAGLAVAPASPLLVARELAGLLSRARARVVVAAAGAAPLVAAAVAGIAPGRAPEVLGLDEAAALGDGEAAEPMPAVDPGAPALLLGSSGTGGPPKTAVLSHRAFVAAVRQFGAAPALALGDRDVVGMVLPFAHGFGAIALNHALRHGARVVSLPRFDLDAFLRMIQEHRVTTTFVPPPVALAIAEDRAAGRYDLSSLRTVLIGAAPLPAEAERAVAARLGCVVGQGLGMTEAEPLALPGETVVRGSVGHLVPGTEAVVVDPATGGRLPEGEAGELWVRGPQLMTGYLGDGGATAATIDPDGWLHTGDLVAVDGGRLFVVDRLKELIKCNGLQVAPAELEAELASHPAVADAAVVPRPHPTAGQVPVAYVALRRPVEPGAVAAWLAERVAPHKRLWDVVTVDRVPRSPTGKILRRLLTDRERDRPPAGTVPGRPGAAAARPGR